MDAQEMNKACELAFLVAREGVEQDPPIDPPASMRMFLYVRQFPQRALTVARQTLAEDPGFRARVAAAATVENTGADAMQWLAQPGVLSLDDVVTPATSDSSAGQSSAQTAVSTDEDTTPVTKEAIRTELDELKSLVGQLADERAAVGDELSDLETRLDNADQAGPASEAAPDSPDSGLGSTSAASAAGALGGSMAAQVRSLHADLRQARSDRDAAQEAKEIAIVEQAELMEELEQLKALSTSAEARLNDLEAKIETVSGQKNQLEEEKSRLDAETARLTEEAKSFSTERDDALAQTEKLAAERAEAEAKLAAATADMERLTAELSDVRSTAGASVSDLQAAIAAQEALSSHVDSLSAAQAAARLEMDRVNAALADRSASDGEKITALQSALASVVAERDELATKLELVRSSVTSVQGEMATLDATVSDVEASAGTLGDRVSDLSSSVAGIETDEITPVDTSTLDTPDAPAVVVPVMEEIPEQNLELEQFQEADVAAIAAVEDTPQISEAPADGLTEAASDATTDHEIRSEDSVPSDEEASEDEPAEVPASDVSETDFTAGLLDDLPRSSSDPEIAIEADAGAAEDIDEVHALVAETVATFDSGEAGEEDQPTQRSRGGLTSLFTSTTPAVAEAAPVAEAEAVAQAPAVAESEPSVEGGAGEEEGDENDETMEDAGSTADNGSDESVASTRSPIAIPQDIMADPVAVARHVVRTEDAVLLIDGDPVAALGWPSVDRIDQRRNLVHFLSQLAGSSGVAPDVLFDRDNGTDRLPDSRSVRVRITNEEGSVAAQVNRLIDTYPGEWPVVVVTDNMDLATEVAMKGATILDNGQLLDLFIAS